MVTVQSIDVRRGSDDTALWLVSLASLFPAFRTSSPNVAMVATACSSAMKTMRSIATCWSRTAPRPTSQYGLDEKLQRTRPGLLMKNVADTETYTVFDHVLSKTVRSLSHVVGLRKITQPFWARWLASGIRPEVIFQFLDELGTIDGWATAAARIVGQEIRRFQELSSSLPQDQRAAKLRELSYICNLAQWGSLPITEDRKRLYAQCRDFYIEAESLVFAQCYRRIDIPFEDVLLHAN